MEWLLYAAACAYRKEPDHWLLSSETMCAAIDVIYMGQVKLYQARPLGNFRRNVQELGLG